MSEETENTESSGLDRRAALKKAAVAAGVVAWTTPTVQALTPGIASAAGRVTNCAPVITYTLFNTGSNCAGVPAGVTRPNSPSCCSAQTYILVTALANCGDNCPSIGITTPARIVSCAGGGCVFPFQQGNCDDNRIIGIANCAATSTVTLVIETGVQCGDGVTYTCTQTVQFNVANCPVNAAGTVTGGSCVPA